MHKRVKHFPRAIVVTRRKLIATLGLVLAFAPTTSSAAAENLIVAFGASQTYGKGVGRDKAYPAQLEQLLRLNGYNVRVVNSGVNGQTTSTMLQRLEKSVPAGTSLVIFQPGGNDKRKGLGAERAENVSEIRKRLSARGVPVIMMENKVFRNYPRQADGQHLTVAGYRGLAQSLVSRVTEFLAK